MKALHSLIILICTAAMLLSAMGAPEGSPAELCTKAKALLAPGKGQVRDRNAAIEHLRAAADAGHAGARSMLGRLLLDFCYLTCDREQGLALLRQAKEGGDSSNPTLIGAELTAPEPFRNGGTEIYFTQRHSRYYNDTILLPATPGKKGLVPGYGDELSMLYDYSEIRSLPQEKLKALADKGDTCAGILWAYRELQMLLYNARRNNTRPDATREAAVLERLQQAAEQGYEQAALVLAAHYGALLVYAADSAEEQQSLLRKAERYMYQAAEQQVQEAAAGLIRNAMLRAHICHEPLPDLPPQIIRQGLDYLEARACAKEDATVQLIGQAYLWGLYTEPDEARGVKLLERTALSGEPAACQILISYFNGEPLLGKTAPAPRPEKAAYYTELMQRLAPMWQTRSFRDDPVP